MLIYLSGGAAVADVDGDGTAESFMPGWTRWSISGGSIAADLIWTTGSFLGHPYWGNYWPKDRPI